MSKLSIMKLKVAEKYLMDNHEQVLLDGQVDNGRVKVVVDGKKQVCQILISQDLFDEGNKEKIELFTQEAINIALGKVDNFFNKEV
ncbi:MAG: YbaB/EbfC family nucleoid-associated protein [Bacteroidales bacterium]|nr:YbaB/EbfC family nucleoid-associated protein [Bacteroidales bacterium]